MRIDHLHVQNFKGFKDRTFEFPRSVDAPAGGNGSFHLIIGQNGKGKTSALDALAVAAGSWFLGVRGEDSRHIQPDDVRVQINEYGDTQRLEPMTPVEVTASGVVLGHDLSWTRERKSKAPSAREAQGRKSALSKTNWVKAKDLKVLAEDTVLRAQRGEAVTLPLISYYGTGRLWLEPKDMAARVEEPQLQSKTVSPQDVPEDTDDLAESFASRLAGYRYSIDPRCNPADLLRWLEFEQKLAVQAGGQESRQYRVVKEAIRQAVEGCQKVEYHLRLGLVLSIDGQPRLPFRNLSDGQRNIIAMVGDLAFKAAQLNPHLGSEVLARTPGIVLIDELDLHLHPRWQRHIVEDFRRLFPEVQFIATTHSPFIVQTMRDGELISLDSQAVSQTNNLGIENISAGIMGVDRPEVSPLYSNQVAVAKSFLLTLEEAALAPEEKLRQYLDRLSQGLDEFAGNPAYQAFLELKRAGKLGARIPDGENGSTRS